MIEEYGQDRASMKVTMTAHLCLNTWAGRREYPVEIVSETSKRYRVRLFSNHPLPGKRQGKKGDEVLVPKYAVRIKE